MNSYINYYTNSPTPGGTDGTAVSQDGAQTQPITMTLDASGVATMTQAVALRCQSGFETSGAVNISFTGTNAGKWSISENSAGPFSPSLTLSTKVGATNVVFYTRAFAAPTEPPQNDTSVSIVTTAKIVPA